MSKLSFRARALDATKPMPIYWKRELSDLQDYSVLNRAVPQMPSGMEKEEESEHHLQRAISAQQVYGDKKVMVIPVPEAEISLECYNNLYRKTFRLPKHYIHNQAQALNSILEQDQPDYDLDSDDEKWLKDSKKRTGLEIAPLQFEEMFDRLEKSSGNQLVTLQEAKLLLKEDDDLIKAVHDYWLKKRNKMKGSLAFQVRQERRDGSSSNDCYVAFRRRTEKMQTRKNRKNDESSYEKMLKLRRDLSRAVTILEMVKRREKSKRELLHLTLEVFEKRYQLKDWDAKLLRSVSTQKPRSQFSLSGYKRKRMQSGSISIKHNNIKNTSSISQGKLDRETNVLKKPKTKRPRFKNLQSNSSTAFANQATNAEAIGRLKHSYKNSVPSQKSSSVANKSHQSVFANPPSYPGVGDSVNPYDYPPSSDEEVKEQVGSPSLTDEFDAKKYPDGMFTFRRKPGCVYYSPQQNMIGDWSWMNESKHRYCLTTLNVPEKCIGFTRRRMGRGGRVHLDRAYHPYHKEIENLDLLDEHDHQPPKSQLRDLLKEIKQNRWRHYRPSHEVQKPASKEDTTDSNQVFHWNSPLYQQSQSSKEHIDVKMSKRDHGARKYSRFSSPKHKRAAPSRSLELDKSSIAFAMSALVTMPTQSTTTTVTSQNSIGVSRLPPGGRSASSKPKIAQHKCVTCGGLVTFTNNVTTTRTRTPDTAMVTSGQQRGLTLPVTLSVATTSLHTSSQAQRTTVLPATVTVSASKAGVPALLKISSTGSVVGSTVIYPQPQSRSADDVKTLLEGDKKAARSQRSAVNLNVNFTLPPNVLASIKSETPSVGGSRNSHSAPSSPRSAVVHMLPPDVAPKKTSSSKTISLNLVTSSSAPSMTSSPQEGARLAIGGNVVKLGSSLFTLTPSTNTKTSGVVVEMPDIQSAKGKATDVAGKKTVLSSDENHTVQIDIGSPNTADPAKVAAANKNAASKPSRPMEVT
uniref:Enhancer of polycomb-like protein n=1 Tax=Phallusia mammillata TaxID=59560 RepID=A0A6F9DCL1_9ASCI|nr:enhancer of polycomb homolog 1-like [Phallusia mammillata]